MDRVGASFDNAPEMMHEKLTGNFIPIQFPSGGGDLFTGIIDLISMKFRVYHDETLGMTFEDNEIPASLMDKALNWREKMLEAVSEYDDQLLEMFVNNKEIPNEKLISALRKATIACKITPIMCGSSFKNKGVQHLLDAIVDFLPSPLDLEDIEGINPKTEKADSRSADVDKPFSALAFKIASDPHVGKLTYFRVYSGKVKVGDQVLNVATGKKERLMRILQMHANRRQDLKEALAGDIVAGVGFKNVAAGSTLTSPKHPILLEMMKFPEPVVSVAIEPKTKADQDKLTEALSRLADEDPTFRVISDQETGQTIISGMGELHLEVLVERMLREFKVHANIGSPRVAYKETITETTEFEGKFVRQSGGKGQYGHVIVTFEPLNNGTPFKFENQATPDRIPKEYISSVEAGIRDAMGGGVLAGYPVIGVKAILTDGSFHDVDSSDVAFKVAGSMAFQGGARQAKPTLLEPMMDVEVVLPDEYLGTVMNDLNSRRAVITGTDTRSDGKVLKAKIPLAEMFGYATKLRSLSQGRAVYTMEFACYLPVPKPVLEEMRII